MKTYSTQEIASLFAVSVSTVREWHKKGFIVGRRVNPRGWRRFDATEVEKLRALMEVAK